MWLRSVVVPIDGLRDPSGLPGLTDPQRIAVAAELDIAQSNTGRFDDAIPYVASHSRVCPKGGKLGSPRWVKETIGGRCAGWDRTDPERSVYSIAGLTRHDSFGEAPTRWRPFVYRFVRCIIEILRIHRMNDVAKDAESLVLRHQLGGHGIGVTTTRPDRCGRAG